MAKACATDDDTPGGQAAAMVQRFALYRASGLGKMRAYALSGRDLGMTPKMAMTLIRRQAGSRPD